MNDFIFIFFTIAITTSLIYFLYKMMLGSDNTKESELQITSKDIIEQISILHRQKKYKIVESLANSYLAKKAGDDGVRIILAKALYEDRRVYDAIDQAKLILKHKPKDLETEIFLANCYKDISKPMKAINVYQEILEHDSNNIIAIKELAQLYNDNNQKQSALKMYAKLDELLESNQERVKNKLKIAEIHVLFGNYDSAISEYEDILGIYPDDLGVKKRLIDINKIISNYDYAIDLALDLYENNKNTEVGFWAMKALMDIYRLSLNYDKALEFAGLIRDSEFSDKVESNQDIAKILMEKGQVDESIDILKNLVEKDSGNIELKRTLAQSYRVNDDYEKAIGIYKKILDAANPREVASIHYEMSGIYADWAMYMFSKKDNSECFKLFTTALKFSTENPDIYFRLGNVNKAIKNYNEAIVQYKKAIELDPDIFDYYYAISECYEAIGSVYEQKNVLVDSLKRNSQNALVNYKLGVIADMQNDSQSAITYLKKAIELDEMYIEPKRKLALILEHKGDKEGAIELYEEILKLKPDNEEIVNNLKMLRG